MRIPDSITSHVLVVDDDQRLRTLLQRYLVRKGYWCTCAKDAAHALELLGLMRFDLVVMDIMMPGLSGIGLTHKLRGTTEVPIIMLSAKIDVEDRIEGFRAGADDYVQKPYEPDELVLRIEAVLRRAQPDDQQDAMTVIKLGAHQFDPGRGELRRGDSVVHLTESELTLMRRLAQTPNRAVRRAEFTDDGNDAAESLRDRSIDVRVSRLRQKFEVNPRRPRYLLTVRSEGYMLVPESED